MNLCCSDCAFFAHKESNRAGHVAVVGTVVGECRRYPPQQVDYLNDGKTPGDGSWPYVFAEHWCGEFMRRGTWSEQGGIYHVSRR